MRITRFGDNYASAYELPLLKAQQPQRSNDRIVVANVGGADGEYDFYGEDPFPLNPKKLELQGTLNAATYAGVTDDLDELVAELRGVGRSKLWYETRDSSNAVPIRWAYAKCIDIFENGEIAGKNFVDFPISYIFQLSEGLIYSQSAQTDTDTEHAHFPIINRGNYPYTPVNVEIDVGASDPPLGWVETRSVVGSVIPAPTSYWVWTVKNSLRWLDFTQNGILNDTLEILSDALRVQVGTTSRYARNDGVSAITLASGQVRWITNDINNYSGPTTGQGDHLEIATVGYDQIATVGNTTPITITSSQNHNLSTGDPVRIVGTGIADGNYVITVTGGTTFTLNGTAASGTVSQGYWLLGGFITSMSVGAPCTIQTSVNHGLSNGDIVLINGAREDGNITCNGVWKVSAVTANTFQPVENVSGSDYPALNPLAYSTGAYFYPSPGHTLNAEWYETWKR